MAINIGILAHVDAGKTTLTERMLELGGAIARAGRVDEGTTVTDSMPLERERGMTIRASTASLTWRGIKINIIDTPGHADFASEVERSLSAMDGAIVVISAREGVQAQTRALFSAARRMGLPAVFFVNKLDRAGADAERALAEIRARLDSRSVALDGAEDFAEALAERCDILTDNYLSGAYPPHSEAEAALFAACAAGRAFPVYFGAALRGRGVEALLDAVARCFPSRGSVCAPLSARVYKLERDDAGRRLYYARVYDGALRPRQRVALEEGRLTLGSLMTVDGARLKGASSVSAGDIAVLADARGLCCGAFLGETRGGESAKCGPPPLSARVEAASGTDRPRLLAALEELSEEDPELAPRLNAATGEITLRLYGRLQIEVLESVLRQRFGLDARFSRPEAAYAARPARAASAELRIGRTRYHAGVALTIAPMDGDGAAFESRVSLGALEKSFQNAVEAGARLGLAAGLGLEVVGAKVIFTDMDYDSVMGTPADYRRLTPLVVALALEKCDLRRAEPWRRFELRVACEYSRAALSSLREKRARLWSADFAGGELRATGIAPLNLIKDYAAELAASSGGAGLFETFPHSYVDVPER